MSEATQYGPFRKQVYRLSWLMAFSIFAVVVLMWACGPGRPNEVLGDLGFGLFCGATLCSVVARRFLPFAVALFGLFMVGASIYG